MHHSRHPSSALILASASPRRAELLRSAGITFAVRVSPAPEPERKPPAIPTALWPMCLAFMKGHAVQRSLPRDDRDKLVLAADTIVVGPTGEILNKARDRSHARRILMSLRGQKHQVVTGIALLRREQLRLSSATSTCRMKRLSPAALERYLETGLWKGKAGAYGIQDDHDPFITLLEGDITTVIGLPMPLVLAELASFARK